MPLRCLEQSTKVELNPQLTNAVELSILIDLEKDRCSHWLTVAREKADILQNLYQYVENLFPIIPKHDFTT